VHAPRRVYPRPAVRRSLLYLAPAFLAFRLHKQVRGVQVFDLQLVRELTDLGIDVTLPADLTWRPRLIEHLGDLIAAPLGRAAAPGARGRLRVIYTPPLVKPLWNGLALQALLHRRHEVCLLGNVSRGIAPVVELLRLRGLFGRLVILANRTARPSFLRAIRRWRARVVAVSDHLLGAFPTDLDPPISVYYGIVNAADFRPATPAERGHDGLVHFFMLGKLDTPIKDVPTALRAWSLLPPGVRARARLHLASYPSPPSDLPEGVRAYAWMPASDIPAFMRRMDVMLVPSLSETFGQGLVQAMLTGLPSCCRDFPTLREKVENGGGLLFTTPEELAAHIERLVNDPDLRRRMGRLARETALARYVWSTRLFADRFLFPTELGAASGPTEVTAPCGEAGP
jgi:glycosyltransferase involved in cell wall biosynthesis